LTIPGKATHAAMRWDGVSAIEKFNMINQSIIELEKQRHSSFSVKYYESPKRVAPINIGTIKGGEWHSTVPESVVVEGRFGVFPGESVSDARMAFSDHLKKVSNADSWLKENPLILEWFEGQFESGKTDVEHSIINNLKMAYEKVNNSSAKIEGVTYGSDLRLFTNHADIPAVLFGPGDVTLAHSANEYVEIEEVLTCIKTISNLIINWCEE
jgi:acetylornithine deacetylase